MGYEGYGKSGYWRHRRLGSVAERDVLISQFSRYEEIDTISLSVVDVWVPMLWRWTAFELNHSVGGNWALKELIWHWDLLVFLNSLDSSDSFLGLGVDGVEVSVLLLVVST
jgi:hypothetical protein